MKASPGKARPAQPTVATTLRCCKWFQMNLFKNVNNNDLVCTWWIRLARMHSTSAESTSSISRNVSTDTNFSMLSWKELVIMCLQKEQNNINNNNLYAGQALSALRRKLLIEFMSELWLTNLLSTEKLVTSKNSMKFTMLRLVPHYCFLLFQTKQYFLLNSFIKLD